MEYADRQDLTVIADIKSKFDVAVLEQSSPRTLEDHMQEIAAYRNGRFAAYARAMEMTKALKSARHELKVTNG